MPGKLAVWGWLLALWACLPVLQLKAQVSTARKSLSQEFRQGKIRVFYDIEGDHAVAGDDVDRNGRPDQVEDIAKQTWAAYTLLVDALGFPDPFKTERFGSASFLDIHLLNKKTLGSNGVAYDELQRFRRPADPPDTRSLCFNVATSVKANANLTPAHELFHLIQYGTSYFKNAWYSEGMARWSECALGRGGLGKVGYTGPFPLPPEKQAALFEMSYQAANDFWNPLALLDDPRGALPEDRISRELKEATYANGQKVLEDFNLNGWQLMRDVLVELGKVDRAAYARFGYDRWSEENQNSKQNSPLIYQAVLDVLGRRGHKLP